MLTNWMLPLSYLTATEDYIAAALVIAFCGVMIYAWFTQGGDDD